MTESETVSSSTSRTGGSQASALDIFLFAGAIGLLGMLYWQPIYETYLICFQDDDYSHGILLPFISAYLIWEKRSAFAQISQERRARKRDGSILPGMILFTGGLLLLLIGRASDLMWIKWLSLFPVVIGFIMTVFGAQLAGILFGPIVLNFMAKPFPDSLVPRLFFPLQVLAAKIAAATLELLGVPVYLFGNIIEIPGMKLMVEEACSGMRSMMAILTVAVIVSYTIRTNVFGKLLLFAGSIALAIILNVFRVTATGVLAHFYDPAAASGFFHSFSGMVVFVVGMIALFGLGKVMERFLPAAKGSS